MWALRLNNQLQRKWVGKKPCGYNEVAAIATRRTRRPTQKLQHEAVSLSCRVHRTETDRTAARGGFVEGLGVTEDRLTMQLVHSLFTVISI
jgi:hypothetical protein